jgi:hypothetical protein
MSFDVPDTDHFEGGQNINEGHAANGDTTLAGYLRKTRTGQTTHAGAGTETLTFSEPFDDANYTVSLAPDTAGMDPIWANKTAASVDVTVTAAGAVDVTAIHD